MGSLLFGVESVILSDEIIDRLESIQSSFAKSVLGVRDSTANVFGLLELGLKSIRQRIYEVKIRFFDWVRDLPKSRLAHQALLENLSDEWRSDYIDHIAKIERETGILLLEDRSLRRSAVDSWGRKRLRTELDSKSSLSCLPLPTQGWRKNKYVCDSDWSRTLSMFRGGNAKLGK